MSDVQWSKTIPESGLEEGKPQVVKVGEKEVLLVRIRGAIRAVAHQCTHYQEPLTKGALTLDVPSKGRCTVTCSSHFARFDLETGEVLGPPALDNLQTYSVRVEDGTILLAPAKRAQFPPLAEGDSRVFVIVGGGAAAEAAAETLRREGFGGRVIMVTREQDRPYDRPNLSKEYLSGEAKPEWMPLRSEKFLANRKIEVLTGRTVIGLDTKGRRVELDGGEKLAYDKLLLASGSEPKKLSVPGANLPGVFTLRSMADGRALVAAVEKAKRVAVVGASFIAMEAASALRKRGLEVEVIAPESAPMVDVFGDRVAARLRALHEKAGVRFKLGRTVKEIADSRGVKKLTLSDGEVVEADVVLVGVGVVPSVGYLPGTGLVENGGVPVGEDLQTKNPGVYAAGDIAIVRGFRIEHWAVAESHGAHAARAMLGKTVSFAEVPFFWTRQCGQSLKYVGFPHKPDSIRYLGDVDGGQFLAGYFAGGVLRAAVTYGRAKELIRIQEALGRGESIAPERFIEGAFAG